MTDISIIIVNYNKGTMLTQCIESVKEYTPSTISLEFIVVDNSDAIDVREYLVGLTDVVLIKNETNRGFAAANNQGLNIARGKYILYLNNDTLFLENTLSDLIRFYAEVGGNTIIGCKLLNKDMTHQFSVIDFDSISNRFGEYFFIYNVAKRSKYFNKFHLNYTHPDSVMKVDVVKGAFLFTGKEEMMRLNGFDESFFFYNEEFDLCWRLKQSGGSVWYYPKTSIIHLGGSTTQDMPYFSIKNLAKTNLTYFQKHNHRIKRWAYYVIHYLGYAIRVPIYALQGVFTLDKKNILKSWNYARSLFQLP
jgi:GT2 family glycosyltransferase